MSTDLQIVNENPSKIIKLKIPPRRYPIEELMNRTISIPKDYSIFQNNKPLLELIDKGKKIYGDVINYFHINPNIVFQTNTFFELECLICNFTWSLKKSQFLAGDKSCSWCKTKCLHTPKNSLYVIVFVGIRIHENKYDYSYNNPENSYSTESILKIKCRKEKHKIFEERVGKHLSRAKTNAEKSEGCPECNEEEKVFVVKEAKKAWKNNLELVKTEGKRIHGDIYNYDLNISENIINSKSIIKIQCLQIRDNGEKCMNIFEQRINNHIHMKNGCKICEGKEQYNFDNFIKKFNEKYSDGQFLLHHIKKEDIIDAFSRPILECSVCGFLIKDTTINDLINSNHRQCERCINRERWTPERLKMECARREKEGEYLYNLVNYDEITNGKYLLNIICIKCLYKGYKYIFTQNVTLHFTLNCGCQRCNGSLQWTPERCIEDCELKQKEGKYSYELTDFSKIDCVDSLLNITCIFCKNEGHEDYYFRQTINGHFNSCSGCPRCSGKLLWTSKRFLKESKLKEKEGKYSYEFVDIDSIDNVMTVIPITCLTCKNAGLENYVFLQCINNHFNNDQNCPRCSNCLIWSEQRCIQESKKFLGVYSYNNEEFKNVKNSDSMITIDCLICKEKKYERYQFQNTVTNHFTNRHGCYRCGKCLNWDYLKFLEEIYRLPKSFTSFFDYSFVKKEMIVDKNSIIPLKCLICENRFERSVYDHILNLSGCSFCKKSKGEKAVYMFLKYNNIQFEDEVSILGYNGNKFRYDFVVVYRNEIIVIEYDGRGHFEIVNFWQNEKEFIESRKRDIYKQKVALDNNKRIIRIDYTVKLHEIPKHLEKGLECKEKIYYSNPSLYTWLN